MIKTVLFISFILASTAIANSVCIDAMSVPGLIPIETLKNYVAHPETFPRRAGVDPTLIEVQYIRVTQGGKPAALYVFKGDVEHETQLARLKKIDPSIEADFGGHIRMSFRDGPLRSIWIDRDMHEEKTSSTIDSLNTLLTFLAGDLGVAKDVLINCYDDEWIKIPGLEKTKYHPLPLGQTRSFARSVH